MKEEEILAKKSAMPNKKTNQQAPPQKKFLMEDMCLHFALLILFLIFHVLLCPF